MTKGYIEVDIPESCKDCQFSDTYDLPICVWCNITRKAHNGDGTDKPDWCPIKEMPDELKGNKLNTELEAFMRGWNEMIDEMFGGEDADTKTTGNMR